MEDFVVMKFRDEMVDYMVQANPEQYRPYVTYENGKKVVYVRLLKALTDASKAPYSGTNSSRESS